MSIGSLICLQYDPTEKANGFLKVRQQSDTVLPRMVEVW